MKMTEIPFMIRTLGTLLKKTEKEIGLRPSKPQNCLGDLMPLKLQRRPSSDTEVKIHKE